MLYAMNFCYLLYLCHLSHSMDLCPSYYINFKCCVLVKNYLTNHYQIYQKKSKLHVTPVGYRNCNITTFKPSLTKFWCEMGNKFIVPTMLAKPRPPWLLVAMSHIFIIMAISALKFSR